MLENIASEIAEELNNAGINAVAHRSVHRGRTA